MSNMTFSLQLLDSPGQIKHKIMDAMRREITRRLGSMAFRTALQRRSRKALKDALESTNVYQSMVAHDGRLRAELGVVDSETAMNRLVRDWVKTVEVKVMPPKRFANIGFFGSIVTIEAVQADYQDVLDKAYASYQTEKGETIPWLQWLLKEGDRILIVTHKVFHPSVPTARSRTGTNTIMKKTRGAGWGVPAAFAGTDQHNFCTRAIANALNDIGRIIQEEVTRRI